MSKRGFQNDRTFDGKTTHAYSLLGEIHPRVWVKGLNGRVDSAQTDLTIYWNNLGNPVVDSAATFLLPQDQLILNGILIGSYASVSGLGAAQTFSPSVQGYLDSLVYM